MRVSRSVGQVVLAPLVVGWAVVGCKPKQAAFAPPPPGQVSVAKPLVKTLPQTLEYTGFTRGADDVEVRAQVRGLIQSRKITGGEKVKKGDLLFNIDPRPFQASVGQAEADVASNEAKLRLAQNTLDRKQQSAMGNAVSKLEVDQAIADRDAAAAQLKFSQSKLVSAQLDLEYTQIRAPINGRVDVAVANIGALVGEANTAPLCKITDDSMIYVRFNVPEQTVLTLRKQFLNQRPGEGGRPTIPIYVGFSNDRGYPFVGRYERGDAGFDSNTGTTVVEGIFDNAKGMMVPGAFARIKTIIGQETVTLVPDAAVGVDQSGRFVLTVDAKNTVVRLPVEVGGVIDQMRKITTPLPEGTMVVVNGLQRARPGVVVAPTAVDLPDPKLDVGVDLTAANMPSTAPTTEPTTQATTRTSNDETRATNQ